MGKLEGVGKFKKGKTFNEGHFVWEFHGFLWIEHRIISTSVYNYSNSIKLKHNDQIMICRRQKIQYLFENNIIVYISIFKKIKKNYSKKWKK